MRRVKEHNLVAVVVAQLAEWSPPTPEDLGSNLAISNFIQNIYLLLKVPIEKIKKKKPGIAHVKKHT